MSLLKTQGLGKDYGPTQAVKALDLEVGEGEIFGLLGPNGAGKTTAISMITGVVTPTRGTAFVGGFDVRRQAFQARALVGLVPQDLALYEDLSAQRNLVYFGRLAGLKGGVLRERVQWALSVAGLEERAGERVSRYSGGMKRRLNLAAGILARPRLLVLDEPTVGVDPQSRAHIFDCVRQLRAAHGATVLYTSHYMEEVQALCERVAIMDRGELIALGRIEELLAEHGGGMLELVVDGDEAELDAALAPFGEARRENGRILLPAPESLSALVAAVEGSGARILGLEAAQDSLESVFLKLTGHKLRDAS